MSADGSEARVDHEDAPDIELDRDHHNGHVNEEKGGFDACYPVIVHARSKDEARRVAELITSGYTEDSE